MRNILMAAFAATAILFLGAPANKAAAMMAVSPAAAGAATAAIPVQHVRQRAWRPYGYLRPRHHYWNYPAQYVYGPPWVHVYFQPPLPWYLPLYNPAWHRPWGWWGP